MSVAFGKRSSRRTRPAPAGGTMQRRIPSSHGLGILHDFATNKALDHPAIKVAPIMLTSA
jgi:hypothetical protein